MPGDEQRITSNSDSCGAQIHTIFRVAVQRILFDLSLTKPASEGKWFSACTTAPMMKPTYNLLHSSRVIILLAALLSLAGCQTAPKPGAMTSRQGDEIVVA